jgi:hypothetical protein
MGKWAGSAKARLGATGGYTSGGCILIHWRTNVGKLAVIGIFEFGIGIRKLLTCCLLTNGAHVGNWPSGSRMYRAGRLTSGSPLRDNMLQIESIHANRER